MDFVIIKYLLSAKALLQSLNLVHLQFLEQRTDLGKTEICLVFLNITNSTQTSKKKLVIENSFRLV